MCFRTFAAICAAVCMFGAPIANASPLTNVTVRYVGTYGNGVMFILFTSPIAEPGCESSEVRIAAAHPEKKNWMALALAAAQRGSMLAVKTEGCTGSYPLLGETTNSALLGWGVNYMECDGMIQKARLLAV